MANLYGLLHKMKMLFAVMLSILCIAGCSSLGISNGSVEYQTPNVMPPLNMGDEDAQIQQPILPLPPYSAFSTTNQFTNKAGNRFEMPKANTSNQ